MNFENKEIRNLVIFDGACTFCTRAVRLMGWLDVFNKVKFITIEQRNDFKMRIIQALKDVDLNRDMHLISDDKIYLGFVAYQKLSLLIFLCWPFVPLFYLWLFNMFGKNLYRNIANSRICKVGAKQ